MTDYSKKVLTEGIFLLLHKSENTVNNILTFFYSYKMFHESSCEWYMNKLLCKSLQNLDRMLDGLVYVRAAEVEISVLLRKQTKMNNQTNN